jgi:heterodisulfide reductase subunit A
MDFERLLSSTGPFEGEILRGSDKKHPEKIAWIQCVGSRRVTEGDNSYCSGVCCTYTQKQVILTKDHNADAQCAIFHNDIRSFGKDFERYYQRTADLPGVRFIRSYVSIIGEDPETKNVKLKYATADEGVKEEEFDMVVLSVGLNPPADHEGLAETYGIDSMHTDSARSFPPIPWRPPSPGSL